MEIGIASDHAGFPLKAHLVSECEWLSDYGTHDGDTSVHYPEFAQTLCRDVVSGKVARGVLICGSGLGMSMVANRHAGIRAACCTNEMAARLSRAHNDANVLCMGAWLVAPKAASELLHVWLNTPFEGGRHRLRLDMFPGETT
jgi:ribose 5-phosphate isomerase B